MLTGVICIGNELLLDDGAGPACGRYLAGRYELPCDVEVIDRAVMGMMIISDLRRYDRVLVIDAVDVPGSEPGTLFSFAPDAIAASGQMTSLHEVRFADVLQAAALIGIDCVGHCLGIQVENISPDQFVRALTPRVAAAVPLLAGAAARFLRDEWGLDVRDTLPDRDVRRACGMSTDEAGTPEHDAQGRATTEDVLAGDSGDLGAAGAHGEGEGRRDFSGARAGHDAAEVACVLEGPSMSEDLARFDGVAEGPFGIPLPVVFGRPDASVMAGYLASGLSAVGATSVGTKVIPGERADAVEVRFTLGGMPTDRIGRAKRVLTGFGIALMAREDELLCRAVVTPAIQDYDCDALIGACLGLMKGSDD